MDAIPFGKSNLGKFGDIKSEGTVADELFNEFINFDHVNAFNSTRTGGVEADNVLGSFKTKPAEGVKRSASGDIIAPASRHHRSLSVDSAMLKYDFSDEYLKTPPLSSRSDHLSPSNSAVNDSCCNKVNNLDFGNVGEFNDLELKKIMSDEKLAEIAISDPKRAKRILANRQSAARSKERKLRYISELEHKVQTLQSEATTLSTQVTILQKDYAELKRVNNELKFHIQALEQQAKLKDDLNNALSGEIQRLKLGNMELRDEQQSNI
ncbi:hypothetical protein M569_13289 [Genlisea aurea]|uniref:BZIP domain-containing protein n=1 Tax=Genlisea aurea TaxID=192259 RepID=S8C4C5_9LAMI|nr:hypothetical protein M569_13289 [Genlisea aurea]